MQIKINNKSFIPFANKANAIVAVSEYSKSLLERAHQYVPQTEIQKSGTEFVTRDFNVDTNARVIKNSNELLTVPVERIYNGIRKPITTDVETLNLPSEKQDGITPTEKFFI